MKWNSLLTLFYTMIPIGIENHACNKEYDNWSKDANIEERGENRKIHEKLKTTV